MDAGDWDAAARAQALPDQEPGGSDDEVFGDFEDMETGLSYHIQPCIHPYLLTDPMQQPILESQISRKLHHTEEMV